MYVKVGFSNYYKEYDYEYSLSENPEVGDSLVVMSPTGLKIVKCQSVHLGKSDVPGLKKILGKLEYNELDYSVRLIT